MLSISQQRSKRFIDVLFSLIAVFIAFVPVFCLFLISSILTRSFGIFKQERVGLNAKTFKMFKIKTMREYSDGTLSITAFGKFLRKFKLDELPQLLNVLIGDMSIVGPRPDIQGYADVLKDNDRIILSVRPGITGPATLKFSNEEETLSKQKKPLEYNDSIIWPQKVEINKIYIQEWNLMKDFRYMYLTFLQFLH